MIEIDDLYPCLQEDWFKSGYGKLERNLLRGRLGLKPEPLSPAERGRLTRFSQAVMAGAAIWSDPRSGVARALCQAAADIEASLATSGSEQHLSLVKAMILYDLAGLPGASSSYATRNGFDERFRDFFTRGRESIWGSTLELPEVIERLQSVAANEESSFEATFERALGELAQEAGLRFQKGEAAEGIGDALGVFGELAASFELPITGDDFQALSKLLSLRAESETTRSIAGKSNLSLESIRRLRLPLELWPAQREAVDRGILDTHIQSFGFAAPTGTGKTSLTHMVIADALAAASDKKILYICPSRALVRQVTFDLTTSLGGIAAKVVEVGAHLTVHDELPISPDEADVLVFTPERADLLLRVNPDFLAQVGLLVVDEAHHIEQAGRGVLLEFYLWRLRKIIPPEARIVQLSAVTPNIAELTDWLGESGKTESVMVDWRASRLRVGVLERSSNGAAQLQFGEGQPYTLLAEGKLPRTQKEGIAVLADHLSSHGTVLVLCTSTGMAEDIAKLVCELRPHEQDVTDDVSVRLDAWIERELYAECPLRRYYKFGVVYHHAKLPPRVRSGVEEAIKEKKANVICATTTLAEGINFPFSTVIVSSLVGKDYELSPRALWNIAGRAGRFGVDTEGHCLIYRPELWKDRLKGYRLEDYLKTGLAQIPPVKSALATGIQQLQKLVETKQLPEHALRSLSLSDIKVNGKATQQAKNVRALINIMRVGYAHASSSGLIDLSSEEFPEFEGGLLASRQLNGSRNYALMLARQQRSVVREATHDNEEFVQIAARVGWSLEAQRNIYDWLAACKDWQLEQFGHLVVGGALRDGDKLGYLIGPLAKNLLAFEGQALGGFTSFIAQKWISGIPLSGMGQKNFGQLVSTIYGRIQYLLPWGLYGLHELLEYEAKRRRMTVGTGVRDLSVLAAEGIPDFDALQLVMQLGVERVDAARLSRRYRAKDPQSDIIGWFQSREWNEIEQIVRGSDRRRLDPTLSYIHRSLQQ